ncbi:LysR substrate-binding domain-containing protein [Humitalea sp. 24SJ18S-53]|uniref:LysR substrate-binding domain-containing protein n=1 Tax=Humitalea sp. 24SJ18S-53 TaxID=3422307 RepID=UPI003D67A4D0
MPRSLSQRGLQAFLLTVLTGSVSAAADTIGRSQPAVSRLLKELEHDVGFRLFDRVKGRLHPTQEGRLLFEELQRSFTGLDRIASIAGEIRLGRRGTISLGAMPAAAALLPRVMQAFSAQRPGTAITFHTVPSEAVVHMLLTQGCDLGFISGAAAAPGLRTERRYVLPCYCVLPPGHHLAGKQRLLPEDLAGEALVTMAPSTRIGQQFAAILEQHGVDKLTRVETHLSYIVSDLVMAAVGIGVVDAFTAAAHVAKGGLVRPFEPAITFEVKAVHVAETELSATLALLLTLCDQVFRSLPDLGLPATR